MNTKLKPEFMAIVDESTPVTLATAQRWFRQRSTDDFGDLAWLATEHNHLIRADAMRLLGPALVEDLHQSVVSGHSDLTQASKAGSRLPNRCELSPASRVLSSWSLVN